MVRGRIVENVRVRLIIEGHVQGVWFRESTRRQASALGVAGWVKNRPDRSVEVLAEGPAEKVEKLVAWCHKGPPGAEVRRVSKILETWQGTLDAFEITYH
jgi:acylphosphatase